MLKPIAHYIPQIIMMWFKPLFPIGLALLFLTTSCVSYERLRFEYGSRLEVSDLEGAAKLIEKKKWYKKDRNKVLYYLELGALARMQGKYAESNEYFNQADQLIEDFRASIGAKGLAAASNARVLPYRTEYFENIAVHYYKSLNYLQLNDISAARVEARRTNIKLQQLNDAVPDKPFKYHDDVLGHLTMALSYEKNGEWNNAFIAYRNAAELFIRDDKVVPYMGVSMPSQLKCDVVRMARKVGFEGEVSRLNRILRPQCRKEATDHGSLVLFWENGQSPVKKENILGFDLLKGRNGNDLRFVNYTNDIEYALSPQEFNQLNGITEINNIRIALPSYVPRFYPLHKARVQYTGGVKEIELIEDLEEVAQQSLRDRFHRELASALIRVAVKEATEASLRQIKTKKKDDDDDDDGKKAKDDDDEDEYSETAGIILSGAMDIFNTITERADLRSWHSLPATISYTRIPLQAGTNKINVQLYNRQGGRASTYSFTVNGNGNLLIKSIISPDSYVLEPGQQLQN
jgi:tetratricopeptide (TPR) repeat protein